MGFFGRLLGHPTAEAPPATVKPVARPDPTPVPSPGPTQGIAYDPKLVPSLLEEHAQLGKLFGQIGEMHRAGNADGVCRLLSQFKSRIEAHVLTENVRFYNFLEQSMRGDGANVELMRSFRRDMNDIVRQVINFVKRYQQEYPTPQGAASFGAAYQEIAVLLERRLDSEEGSLYPMYVKPA